VSPALLPADDPRITIRRPGLPDPDGGAVVYWMQRAQRAADNPALEAAIAAGNLLNKPVVALFVLVGDYPSANRRHYQFMLEGLRELPAALASRRVGFVLRTGRMDEVARFCDEVGAALLVGDENPLREPEGWRRQVADAGRVPFWTVDADVVVPSVLLEKEQYSAATIRPRIHRQLEWCLRPVSRRTARVPWEAAVPTERGDAALLLDRLAIDARVSAAPGWKGGGAAARAQVKDFVARRLSGYAAGRNEPARDATSRLSPYLHFGQIGPCEVAAAVNGADAPAEDRQAFLEEFIVRRELAVNFVRFNSRYDRLECCERWARATLDRHRADDRPWRYTESQLEEASTHDELWNASQRQMMESGWMHGYLRMYWAKKILEWSASPEEAMAAAIALNDRYELDGRDPNGYAGIAWAIGGKHDRPWGERPIFGTVRYMSLGSTSRKFDSRAYIRRWSGGASLLDRT
jgi:deoxyribodipyrimidine photo-lyase